MLLRVTRKNTLTKAGIESAQKRGHRPDPLTLEQRDEIKRRVTSGEWSQAEAARLFDVDKSYDAAGLKQRG